MLQRSRNLYRFVRIAAWIISIAGVAVSLTWNSAIEARAFALLKENAMAEAALTSYSADYKTTEARWEEGIKRTEPSCFLSTVVVARANHQVKTITWKMMPDRTGHYTKKTPTDSANPVYYCAVDHGAASWFWSESGSHYQVMRDLALLPHRPLAWIAKNSEMGYAKHLASLRLLDKKESVENVLCDVVTFRWEEYYCRHSSGIHEGRLYIGPDRLLRREVHSYFALPNEEVGSTDEAQWARTTNDTQIRNIRMNFPLPPDKHP